MKRFKVPAVLGLMGMMLFAQIQIIHGQVANGTIRGTARDSTGAVLPGVSVSAKSLDTGIVRSVVTDSLGTYQIINLPAKAYEVRATLDGFQTSVRSPVTVTVGAAVVANFELAIGGVTQEVTVISELAQVNTIDASLGGLVGEREVRELPLNGRDWLQLTTLEAGVKGGIGQQSSADFSNSRAARGNGIALSISGNRPTGNVFLVDGLVVNDFANASPGSGLNVNLGVEAVQEFRVLTNEYTAEYGRSTGGVVTAVFKSGGNEFRGNVFEFVRNSALDGKNYFDVQKPPFQRYQFGGSAGGPIIKNKTFVFADYEELRESRGISHNSDTLSPDARNGLVCVKVGSNPCGAKTSVPISPRIQPYLAFFPVANGPINGDTAKFNFAGQREGLERYAVGKVDHNFSNKTMLWASFQIDNTDESQPDPYNQKRTGSPSRHENGVVTLQRIFTSNFLNTTLVGLSHSHITDALDVSAINPIATDTSLGFQPGVPAGLLVVSGLTGTQGGMGSSGSDILDYKSFQVGDDASWTKGRSTIKFGAKVERIHYDKNSLVGAPIGEYDFDTVSLFLQAIPGLFRTDVPGTNDIRGLRTSYLGLYFEDGIAVRSNLRVNLGLRYEYLTPITEVSGLVAVLTNPADATPKTGGSYFNTNTKDFSPRLSIAWDPRGDGKTPIRAGFGIYDVMPLPYLLENRTNSFPFFEEGTISLPPASAFPTGGLGLITPASLRASYVEQNPARAYSMQWNLTIQRQLAANTALTVGYVGSRGKNLPRSIEDVNQVPFSLVTIAPDGHLLFPTNPALKNGGSIQKINPNYSRIAATVWDDFSNYHSLIVDLNKRFSHGLFFKAAYTWSKSMDGGSNTFSDNESTNTSGSPYAFLPALQRGVSDFDITHRFVFSYNWSIPAPSSLTGVSKALLGGWELGGIFTAQSGAPFTVTLTTDQARTGDSRVRSTSGGQRPDYNPAPGCSVNAINPGNPLNYIKTECFSFPALGTLGNLGRNTLRGPGLQDVDASLFKNWPLRHDRTRLQFRIEAFNLFNKANFQAPKVKIFDGSGAVIPTATQLTAPTQTSERQVQLALKLSW
jgi:Carboxypeptidase regulatory-like domain